MHLKPINHRHLAILVLCLFQGLAAYSQAPINSIRVRSPRTKISSNSKLDSLTNNKDSVSVTYQYMDGLGRPVQTVQQQGSPSGNDIVQPIVYDQYGRDTVKYLPYTISADTPGVYQPTAVTDQQQFYRQDKGDHINTPYPLSITHYEPSPLNRALEQGFAGQDWQPGNHTVKTDYASNNQSAFSATPVTNNTGSRKVILYTTIISSDQSQLLTGTGTYATGQLYLTISKDENWSNTDGCLGTVEEYKDLEGHIVCKRTYNQKDTVLEMLSTYYVYDDLGHLAFVLPPIANPDSAGTISQATLDNLCYQYRYDERGRMTQKKLPGKGWEYMVYNIHDQLVATQDANQQAHIQWIYTQYDGLQRITATGTTTLNETRAVLQARFDSQTDTGKTLAWPINQNQSQVLTTNYYDSYSSIPSLPTIYSAPPGASMATTGLLTATKTAVLNEPGDFLLKVFYYDDLGRSVKTYAQHYYQSTVDTGNYDAISSTYNFTNAVTGTTRQHYNYTGDPLTPKLTVNNTFQYDHLGRKLKTWETITGDSVTVPKTMISQLDYNELGQVLTKHLGSTDSLNFLQDVGYRYNERGWLLQSHSGLFTEQLQYNQAGDISGMATIPQYNGNIASQDWEKDTLSNTFAYTYDRLNRLTSGVTADSAYAERNITYDQAGNIQTLSRVYGGSLTDSLVYHYTKNAAVTDQVQTIQDLSADPETNGYAAGTGSYHYDPNGNMNTFSSTNPSAKTYSTTYNLLNLPNLVHSTVSSVYEYDANGEKLSRLVDTNETDYISGIQYDNNRISFIQTEEGRVFPYSTDTSNYYEYYLADHLGNSRIAFDTPHDTLKVEQQDDYLPFGMEISQGNVANPKNEYLYNKKELQEDSQLYDYGARFYDPVIGRNTSIDPKAELNRRWSPYSYGLNNPIRFIDPDGMVPSDFTDEDGNKRHVEDGSTAQYQEVGSGVSLHYEFTGFDQSKANPGIPFAPESNTVNLTTAIQEQQNLNASNTALDPIPGGATFAIMRHKNIFSTVASATNNSSGLAITGVANSMVDQMNCSTTFIKTDQGNAQAVADKGGLGIVGLNENPHGHIVTFSVGTNEDKGQMANIGRNNGFLNINNQGDGTTPVFGSKNMANTQYFILNPAITPKSLPAPKPTTNPLPGL